MERQANRKAIPALLPRNSLGHRWCESVRIVGMLCRTSLALIAIAGTGAGWTHTASCGVIVLSNQTTPAVRFSISSQQAAPSEYVLQAGELVALQQVGTYELSFMSGEVQQKIELVPDSAYSFRRGGDGVQLKVLSVPQNRGAPRDPPAPNA